jgi:molybdopterin-containing oxidoreductase family membrane subunit
MWFERFVIIVTSLHRDFLPSSWGYFQPTMWDISIFIGTLGIFFTLFLLFSRTFPVIAIAEVKSIFSTSGTKTKALMPAPQDYSDVHAHDDAHGHGHGEVAVGLHDKNFKD